MHLSRLQMILFSRMESLRPGDGKRLAATQGQRLAATPPSPMITDVFHKRFLRVFCFRDGVPPHKIHVFLRKAAQVVFQDLSYHVAGIKDVSNTAHGN